MTLRDFAKLAVRKRRAVASGSHKQIAVTSQLPLGQKKEDRLDRYQDYETGTQPQVGGSQSTASFSGGATS